jgi:hypothetical protein
MTGMTIAKVAGAFGMAIGFVLGVVISKPKEKGAPVAEYQQIVELNGVEFVMHHNLVELMSRGTFDDICDRGILFNNIMTFCMRLSSEGWADQHRENSAIVSIKVNGDDTYELRCDPIEIKEDLNDVQLA